MKNTEITISMKSPWSFEDFKQKMSKFNLEWEPQILPKTDLGNSGSPYMENGMDEESINWIGDDWAGYKITGLINNFVELFIDNTWMIMEIHFGESGEWLIIDEELFEVIYDRLWQLYPSVMDEFDNEGNGYLEGEGYFVNLLDGTEAKMELIKKDRYNRFLSIIKDEI